MGIHEIYYTNYFSGSLLPPSRLLTAVLCFLCIRFLSALLGSLQAFLNVSAIQEHNSHRKLTTGRIWPVFKFKSYRLFTSAQTSNCEPYINAKETNFKVIYSTHTEHCSSLIVRVRVKAKQSEYSLQNIVLPTTS